MNGCVGPNTRFDLVYTSSSVSSVSRRGLDDFREAVETLADAERIARRVLGGAHPTTETIEGNLQSARAKLRARETLPPAGDLAEEVG